MRLYEKKFRFGQTCTRSSKTPGTRNILIPRYDGICGAIIGVILGSQPSACDLDSRQILASRFEVNSMKIQHSSGSVLNVTSRYYSALYSTICH